jgi:hypothetical protein
MIRFVSKPFQAEKLENNSLFEVIHSMPSSERFIAAG